MSTAYWKLPLNGWTPSRLLLSQSAYVQRHTWINPRACLTMADASPTARGQRRWTATAMGRQRTAWWTFSVTHSRRTIPPAAESRKVPKRPVYQAAYSSTVQRRAGWGTNDGMIQMPQSWPRRGGVPTWRAASSLSPARVRTRRLGRTPVAQGAGAYS